MSMVGGDTFRLPAEVEVSGADESETGLTKYGVSAIRRFLSGTSYSAFRVAEGAQRRRIFIAYYS